MTSLQERKIKQTGCNARFDNLTRQLYATDASIYQIEPVGAAFPKNAQQASAVVRAAADADVSITPRGAGTSLVGNAIGEGLIVEFSRYNRQITDLHFEKRSVRVGAGVVLDQLNDFLRTHGFCFGPDVATSARATLGGMIANNSSGARVPVYGTTADHVLSLEIVMADLAQKEATRSITKIFVKLKFNDFTRTTAERAGLAPTLQDFRSLLTEAFARTGKPVRLIGVGVRFAETTPESAQMPLL